MAFAGLEARFLHGLDELGAGAEMGNGFVIHQIEQPGGVRVGRVAIVEHQGGTGM